MLPDAVIRPMRPEDVPAAEQLKSISFHDLDTRMAPRSAPEQALRSPAAGADWMARTHHLLATDPGGCWVAEDANGLLGLATSYRRELMWCLVTYAVRPGAQGRGLGRALLDAALQHGRGCLRGIISASADPAAARRYRLAGFDLHPQMRLTGTVDRAAVPVVEKVRDGTPGDRDLLDSLDRSTRGAAHGDLHDLLADQCRLLVSDSGTGAGYAYVRAGSVALLAATNRRTAARLMWAALAEAGDTPITLPHLTAANQWALDVGLAARLQLHQEGYLCLRGMKPPAPYVHHGALL